MRMKASNLIPLFLAGSLWCLTFTCLAFIAFRTVQIVLEKLTTRFPLLARPFSRRPRHNSALDIDIELQELPRATLEDYSETSRPPYSDTSNLEEPSPVPYSTMANNQASSVIPYRMPWNDDEEEDDDLAITPFARLPPPLQHESRAAQQAPLRRIANSRPVVGSNRLFRSKNNLRLTEATDAMGTGTGTVTTSRAGVAGNEEEEGITSLWLTSPLCPSKSYHMYHIARSLILSSPQYRCEALFCLPEAEAACNELLDVVLAELKRYEPNEGRRRSIRKLLLENTCFGAAGGDDGEARASGAERRGWRPLTRRGGGKEEQSKVVKNKIVGEDILVGGELGVDPLEAVAKLILEDVGLFMKGAGEGGEEWRL